MRSSLSPICVPKRSHYSPGAVNAKLIVRSRIVTSVPNLVALRDLLNSVIGSMTISPPAPTPPSYRWANPTLIFSFASPSEALTLRTHDAAAATRPKWTTKGCRTGAMRSWNETNSLYFSLLSGNWPTPRASLFGSAERSVRSAFALCPLAGRRGRRMNCRRGGLVGNAAGCP
jgi:hypothetical protein